MSRFFKLNNIYLFFLTLLRVKNWPAYIFDALKMKTKKNGVYQMRNGLKYYVRAGTSDRGIVNTVVIQDEYGLKKLGADMDTIIDLGGQNGYFSVFASSYADNIYVYEPIVENYNIILKNIGLNDLGDKVHPFNKAASEAKGFARIFLSKNTGGHSMYGDGEKSVEVETTTLPEIFENNGIGKCDLLKIDIEGAEYPILYNLPEKYFKRITRIRMEAHELDQETKNHRHLIDFLKNKGYEVSYRFPILSAERIASLT